MKKRLMQLTGVLGLLFMVLLGADITSKQSKEFITMTIFANEAKAFGCGADFLNHQAPYSYGVPCFGGGGSTDFTIVFVHDCRDSEASCCRIPSNGSPCPTLAG